LRWSAEALCSPCPAPSWPENSTATDYWLYFVTVALPPRYQTSGTPPTALTKADLAYTLLRQEIFEGRLAPQASLDQEALAIRLGLSTTPLREALRRLESEKLVISRPHRDAIVAPLSLRVLEDVYAIRLVLDPLAVMLAASKAADGELKAIRAAFHDGPHDGDPISHLYSNRALHREIYSACGNETLVEVLDMLWDRTDRYRLITLDDEGTINSANVEHQDITDALVARDASRASELMRDHVADSLGRIRKLAQAESARNEGGEARELDRRSEANVVAGEGTG
jgi:DNA-binding GntR family transcriptional regulator